MGHTSARRKPTKGKSIRFGSAVSHECSDKNTDVRLQKRPKKSCTNHQRITQNSHISATRAQLESLGSDDNNDSELRLERRLRRKRTNKQIIDEDDSKDVDEDDLEDVDEHDLQDVDEHDLKDVDEDDLEDVDVDDLEDVDEEYLLTFLNDINEDSYVTHVSRDKEDDPDYCRFIKLKPDQPLDADCEQKDDGILYLKYLDVIEDDENTTPEKSDIVEEIQLGNEFDPKDESDDTCQDYPTFLDYLEKEVYAQARKFLELVHFSFKQDSKTKNPGNWLTLVASFVNS
uniref:Uncharacterized protein n=1 Tax=Cannabis sativa TaxID=3483 RepID=A0A803NJA3_CANSA